MVWEGIPYQWFDGSRYAYIFTGFSTKGLIMGKLTWIKKRVRLYEQYEWFVEHTPPARRSIIVIAVEDYNWMNRPVN